MTKQQIDCIFGRIFENASSQQPKRYDFSMPQRTDNVTKIKWMNDEKEWRQQEKDRRQKVIILFTYHRSGSSFTGQLLNQHPGSDFHPIFRNSSVELKNIGLVSIHFQRFFICSSHLFLA